jgi:hypothetical protein
VKCNATHASFRSPEMRLRRKSTCVLRCGALRPSQSDPPNSGQENPARLETDAKDTKRQSDETEREIREALGKKLEISRTRAAEEKAKRLKAKEAESLRIDPNVRAIFRKIKCRVRDVAGAFVLPAPL